VVEGEWLELLKVIIAGLSADFPSWYGTADGGIGRG